MGFKDLINKMLSTPEDDIEELDEEEETAAETENVYPQNNKSRPYGWAAKTRETPNVVDINSSRPHVEFKKVSNHHEAKDAADVIKSGRILVLNLENCSKKEEYNLILYFIYGVAYALSCDIKRVSANTYVATPKNIPLSGEFQDESGPSTGGYNLY